MNPDIETVLNELAQTAQYMQQTGKLIRESVEQLIESEQHMRETERHMIETERRIEQSNAFMQIIIEKINNAINAAIKAGEHDQ